MIYFEGIIMDLSHASGKELVQDYIYSIKPYIKGNMIAHSIVECLAQLIYIMILLL